MNIKYISCFMYTFALNICVHVLFKKPSFKIRFRDSFRYHYHLPSNVETELVTLGYFVAQVSRINLKLTGSSQHRH